MRNMIVYDVKTIAKKIGPVWIVVLSFSGFCCMSKSLQDFLSWEDAGFGMPLIFQTFFYDLVALILGLALVLLLSTHFWHEVIGRNRKKNLELYGSKKEIIHAKEICLWTYLILTVGVGIISFLLMTRGNYFSYMFRIYNGVYGGIWTYSIFMVLKQALAVAAMLYAIYTAIAFANLNEDIKIRRVVFYLLLFLFAFISISMLVSFGLSLQNSTNMFVQAVGEASGIVESVLEIIILRFLMLQALKKESFDPDTKSRYRKNLTLKSVLTMVVLLVAWIGVLGYEFRSNSLFDDSDDDPKVSADEKLCDGVSFGSMALIKEAESEGINFYDDLQSDVYETDSNETALSYACYSGMDEVASYILQKTKREKYSKIQQSVIVADAICFSDQDMIKKLMDQGYKVTSDVYNRLEYRFGEDLYYGYVDFQCEGIARRNLEYMRKHGYIDQRELENFGKKMVSRNGLCYGLIYDCLKDSQELEYLKKKKLDLSMFDEKDKKYMLYMVSAFGTPKLASEWKKDNMGIRIEDQIGNTVLTIAAAYGNIDMMDYYLSEGLKLGQKNDNGADAFMQTLMYDQKDATEYLLKNKKIHIKDEIKDDSAILYLAAWDDVELYQLLQQYGYSITMEDPTGYFNFSSGKQMLNYLLNTIDLNDKEQYSRLAFWAANAGNTDILDAMEAKGICLNDITDELKGVNDPEGGLLNVAVVYSYFDLTKYLLDHGVKDHLSEFNLPAESDQIQALLDEKR
ncbi:MAG: ankyrin repeat domain-containing protein [Lachnospiraceae bacterium]|nr:ankyrin repeat domain-containing protein [Lachnospiraceae bacterium]